MSLSLAFMFERFPKPGEPILANNVLAFGYVDDGLADALKAVSMPLADGVVLKDGDIGARRTDAYGTPLQFISATFLVPNLTRVARTPWEHSVVAFVSALPPDTRVIPWWH